MESIGLTPHDYAISMADALAFLYWIAKVDANDVEFVLAQPRSNDPPDMNSPSLIHSDVLGTLAIWILDFDCCNDMTLDESGIERAADAFGVMTLITHDRVAQMPLTRSCGKTFEIVFLRLAR